MKSKRTVLDIGKCHCFAVRRAARQVSRLYDAHLDPTGLRITQFLIMAALSEAGQASVNDLAERLDIERTAMGKMIALLERDEYVAVAPSQDDKRIRLVTLTKEGRALFERASPLWYEAQRQLSEINGASSVGDLRDRLSGLRVGNVAPFQVPARSK